MEIGVLNSSVKLRNCDGVNFLLSKYSARLLLD